MDHYSPYSDSGCKKTIKRHKNKSIKPYKT